MAPARYAPGLFPTGRDRSAAPGFHVHHKTAPSPPLTRRRRGERAIVLRAARPSAPTGAGKVSTAPRRNGRGLWGYAPACCGRLCESISSSTLTVRRLYVTKDGSPTRHPALLWSFLDTPQARGRLSRQDRARCRPCRCGLPCPRQGTSPCSRHAGMPSRPRLLSADGGQCVLGLS